MEKFFTAKFIVKNNSKIFHSQIHCKKNWKKKHEKVKQNIFFEAKKNWKKTALKSQTK